MGDATITGGEFRSLNRLGHLLSVENRVSYLYARNQTLGEPLPLIPPMKGFSTLHLHFGENRLMGELEWAAAQKRIAQTASIEDVTGSFAVLNLTWERDWLNGSLTSILRASNLLDRYYHTHTSIGNIPQAGRSLMVSLSYAF